MPRWASLDSSLGPGLLQQLHDHRILRLWVGVHARTFADPA